MTIAKERMKYSKKTVQLVFMYPEEPVLSGQIVKAGNTEGTIVPCGSNETPIGICQRDITQAQIDLYNEGLFRLSDLICPVMITGLSGVVAGAITDMNEWVRSDANGRIVPATLDGSDEIIGINLDATLGLGNTSHIQIHRVPATSAGPIPGGDQLLLEDGDDLLLEDGEPLLLE